MKYDFHNHTLMSDGELLPSELVRRLAVIGMEGIVITDHIDTSNYEEVIKSTIEACKRLNSGRFRAIPGVEITHVPVRDLKYFISEVRGAGAKVVVVHGETIVEPVEEGTNLVAVESGTDVLAHPGLLTEEVAKIAAQKSIFLEVSYRKGHCLGNGLVVELARRFSAPICISSDSHSPEDLKSPQFRRDVAKGAGIREKEIIKIAEVMEKRFRGWLEK